MYFYSCFSQLTVFMSRLMLVRFKRTSPLVINSSPVIILKVVVLPAPFTLEIEKISFHKKCSLNLMK